MSILITGSRGYVGDHILRALQKRKYKPVAFTGDITNIHNVVSQINKNTIVLHLAAKIDNRRDDTYFDVNVAGTMNLVTACKAVGAKLIYVSSIETRGDYGITKQLAQRLVEEHATEGLNAVCIRPCSLKYNAEVGFKKLHEFIEIVVSILKNNDFSEYAVYKIEPHNYSLLFRLDRLIKHRFGYLTYSP